MRRQLLISLVALFLLSPSRTFCQMNPELEAAWQAIQLIGNRVNHNSAWWQGKHPAEVYAPAWREYEVMEREYWEQLQVLEEMNSEHFSRQDQINWAIMKMKTLDEVSHIQYRRVLVPFNAEGGFFNEPAFFLPNLAFETASDYEAYLQWWPGFGAYLAAHQELMRQGMAAGIVAPKLIVNNNLKLLQPWMQTNLDQHPFGQAFSGFPPGISPEEQSRLRKKATQLFSAHLLPAYQDLAKFLEEEYLPVCPDQPGVSALPGGSSYYENRIQHFTTLPISADSVFRRGQEEVARIRQQMEAIIEEVKFQGSFGDFLQFLRTDPQFYAESPAALLSRAAWLSKKAEGKLPELFSHLYELPFTVEPVPDAIAPNYTGGRYVPGSRKQNQPGIYWVNTYDLPSRPYYTLPALTLHEAVPGHHLQIMIAAELEGLPDFRREYYISAFGEGWGLYSEYLGEEMGIYQTPYERFGRYTYEMWRACRLVVDVGLHAKGWTRQQAVEFMANNTALSLHEVNTEIDRYIGWPGQAVSYKIGELTIKALRKQAEEALGAKFDIQQFHHLILRNGSVPLPILEEEIARYIQEERGK